MTYFPIHTRSLSYSMLQLLATFISKNNIGSVVQCQQWGALCKPFLKSFTRRTFLITFYMVPALRRENDYARNCYIIEVKSLRHHPLKDRYFPQLSCNTRKVNLIVMSAIRGRNRGPGPRFKKNLTKNRTRSLMLK